MYTELNAALQATKVLYDITKANKGLTNYNELVAAVCEVNAKLIDANYRCPRQSRETIFSLR